MFWHFNVNFNFIEEDGHVENFDVNPHLYI